MSQDVTLMTLIPLIHSPGWKTLGPGVLFWAWKPPFEQKAEHFLWQAYKQKAKYVIFSVIDCYRIFGSSIVEKWFTRA